MSLDDREWFTEAYEDKTAFSVRYETKLVDVVSPYQRVELFETEAVGRVLVLNGCFMVTEKDAFIYHEMLVHPVMHVASDPRSALVIGGGDGGAVTELVKYPALRHIVLCEIDEAVVNACREHMPDISRGLDDPRVEIAYQDGAAYIAERPETFDVVLVDSTDPVGPARALYEEGFYQAVRRALKIGGAAVFQTESPIFMEDVFSEAYAKLKGVFGPSGTRPYLATIPSYPGGLWSFTMCSPDRDAIRDAARELLVSTDTHLRYYSPDIHQAAMVLPPFVRGAVREET